MTSTADSRDTCTIQCTLCSRYKHCPESRRVYVDSNHAHIQHRPRIETLYITHTQLACRHWSAQHMTSHSKITIPSATFTEASPLHGASSEAATNTDPCSSSKSRYRSSRCTIIDVSTYLHISAQSSHSLAYKTDPRILAASFTVSRAAAPLSRELTWRGYRSAPNANICRRI